MPVSLPLVAGSTSPDGLRGAGGRRDDVDRRRAAAAPVLLRRAVHGLLRRGVAVDRRHQAGLDPDAFLQQHVHDRREAVRRARRVRHDVVLRGVVLARRSRPSRSVLTLALAGGRDDDLLRARGEVALGLLGVGEEARSTRSRSRRRAAFQGSWLGSFVAMMHLTSSPLTTSTSLLLGRGAALLRRDGVLEPAVHRVVLHLVREVVRVGGDVDDGRRRRSPCRAGPGRTGPGTPGDRYDRSH